MEPLMKSIPRAFREPRFSSCSARCCAIAPSHSTKRRSVASIRLWRFLDRTNQKHIHAAAKPPEAAIPGTYQWSLTHPWEAPPLVRKADPAPPAVEFAESVEFDARGVVDVLAASGAELDEVIGVGVVDVVKLEVIDVVDIEVVDVVEVEVVVVEDVELEVGDAIGDTDTVTDVIMVWTLEDVELLLDVEGGVVELELEPLSVVLVLNVLAVDVFDVVVGIKVDVLVELELELLSIVLVLNVLAVEVVDVVVGVKLDVLVELELELLSIVLVLNVLAVDVVDVVVGVKVDVLVFGALVDVVVDVETEGVIELVDRDVVISIVVLVVLDAVVVGVLEDVEGDMVVARYTVVVSVEI
ncbi:uncharacterized protein EV422DRAFT_563005 [Fimicolochytrium jonesii]|uniref:uncharacterized protein n=1 Tax=Fimicolochytrium jonesii TaxID=1396493 RepID=UPI0022FF1376|nr:uncharacterized protein EV422DRAFT_563005 [Fimicolochytrium jonesii]KAI8826940.1 hypothetical protein EV422DRAFT_563005 [Fimicolochytrium jonesii]